MKLSELVKQNFSDAPSDATRVNTNRIPPTKKLNLPFVRSAKRKPEATMSQRQSQIVGGSDPFLEAIGGIGKAGALIPAGSKRMIDIIKNLARNVARNDALSSMPKMINAMDIKSASNHDMMLKWMSEYNRNPLNRGKKLYDPRKYK